MKTEGHLGRCYLRGRQGDAANVVLTAIGHNLRLVLALAEDFAASDPERPVSSLPCITGIQIGFLTDDLLLMRGGGRGAVIQHSPSAGKPAGAGWIPVELKIQQSRQPGDMRWRPWRRHRKGSRERAAMVRGVLRS
jgi:hypothetical protein